MDKLDGLLMQYADKFGENFPLFFYAHLEDSELEKLIVKAITEGKPLEPEYEEGAKY